MGAGMRSFRTAEFAVRRLIREDPSTVFTRGGMIGDSAGHAANGLCVLSR